MTTDAARVAASLMTPPTTGLHDERCEMKSVDRLCRCKARREERSRAIPESRPVSWPWLTGPGRELE